MKKKKKRKIINCIFKKGIISLVNKEILIYLPKNAIANESEGIFSDESLAKGKDSF